MAKSSRQGCTDTPTGISDELLLGLAFVVVVVAVRGISVLIAVVHFLVVLIADRLLTTFARGARRVLLFFLIALLSCTLLGPRVGSLLLDFDALLVAR